jgi:2,5-diamino-6-(ribosylamino)-4(3H)-pyrimidinone 5'-phosphate reductase
MTHYLRSRHDAICVGVGTAVADDPGLNCRLAAADADADRSGNKASSDRHGGESITTTHQPRPIVIDPQLRWDFTAESKVMRLARAGKGLAPYIVTRDQKQQPPPSAQKRKTLEDAGGKYIFLPTADARRGAEQEEEQKNTGRRLEWRAILSAVWCEGLRNIMIEGGAEVINSLLGENAGLVDSVIVTIAPTWLGQGGVVVSPPRTTAGPERPVARLAETVWIPLGEDVVLCGRIARGKSV